MEMADTTRAAPRAFPKGLDVFSAFGSATAADALNEFYKEKEAWWARYPLEMGKLQKKFGDFNGWDKSVYNKWIEALLTLQKSGSGYPAFMNTKAWGYKNLNTSLASWAELKHDFVLYAEQPGVMEMGDGGCQEFLPGPDIEVGYVEPNLLFWNKLDELAQLTYGTLAKYDLLDSGLRSRANELQKFITFLIDVSKKELAKQPLSAKDYETIKYIGGAVENFTLTVLSPDFDASIVIGNKNFSDDYKEGWNIVTGPDRSIAVAADIYTRSIYRGEKRDDPDPKNGVLHVATGKANEIYVVVEINGYLYLTRGATFSYYEFVTPENVRLTDEEWQKIEADKSKRPPLQEWIRGVSSDRKPLPEAVGGENGSEGEFCFGRC